LILIVFRMLFPASLTPGFRSLGRAVLLPPGEDAMLEGMPDVEGARSPLLGRLGAASDLLNSERVGMAPVLLRVLVGGRAGKAVLGGPYEGLDGLGIAAAMMYRLFAGECEGYVSSE
jgi:hypothetical protein